GLVRLDFIDPAGRQSAISRLLENLGRSAQEAREAAARAVTRGIKALARLMRYQLVQTAVAGYEASFKAAANEILMIGRFKTLHDDFQAMEGSFKMVIERRRTGAVSATGAPDLAGKISEELEEAVDALVRDIDLLILSTEKSQLPDDQITWKDPVRRARERLQNALVNQDPTQLNQSLERLQRVLGTQPPQINAKIVEGVARLSLAEVAGGLRSVRDKLSQNAFDVEARVRFEEFGRSVDSLFGMASELHALHANHNWLQNIDVTLQ